MSNTIIYGLDSATGQKRLLRSSDDLVHVNGTKILPFHYFIVRPIVQVNAVKNVKLDIDFGANGGGGVEVDTAGFYNSNNPNRTIERDGGEQVTLPGSKYILIPSELDGRFMRFGCKLLVGAPKTNGMGTRIIQYNNFVNGNGRYDLFDDFSYNGVSGDSAGPQSSNFVMTRPVQMVANSFFNITLLNRGGTQLIRVGLDISAFWGWTID